MSGTTAIHCFTGTGNSLWAARTIAQRLGGAPVLPMHRPDLLPPPGAGILGLVFPVHIWGVPRQVVEFVKRLPSGPVGYCFAVATNGGQVARTLLQLESLLGERGITLASGFELRLPSNYIPWGGPGEPAKLERLFAGAERRLEEIAAIVGRRERRRIERGRLWENLLLSPMNGMAFKRIPTLDKPFLADARCNGCGVCVQVCPAANIRLENSRPVWLGRCRQCMACIQWCPTEAIQYGQRTAKFPRYHHPSVTVRDIIEFHRPGPPVSE